MNGGVVGVFIAPTTNLTVGGGRLFDGAPDSPEGGREGGEPWCIYREVGFCFESYSRTYPQPLNIGRYVEQDN